MRIGINRRVLCEHLKEMRERGILSRDQAQKRILIPTTFTFITSYRIDPAQSENMVQMEEQTEKAIHVLTETRDL